MNVEQATQVTVEIFKHDPTLVVCWVGGSGLGKTTQARKVPALVAGGKEFVYAPIRSEDAMGLNLPNKTRDRIEFVPHTRLARAITQPCVLYLDEFNRVERYTRAALMELLGERTVGGQKLHPQTNILLTLNDESENYDTIEGDKAFKTRVIPIPVKIDHALSISYARDQKFDMMAEFIGTHAQVLNEEVTWNIKPDTRFLEYLNRLANINSVPMELYNEIVTFALTSKYVKPFLKTRTKQTNEKLLQELEQHHGVLGFAERVIKSLKVTAPVKP